MKPILKTCLALVAALLAGTAAAQARFDFDTAPGRLPKSVVPSRYVVTLALDPRADGFDGAEAITLRVREPVRQIVLHARLLAPVSARLGTRVLEVRADEAAQTWTLVPADGAAIAPGEHRLELAWRGRVQRSDEGLYVAPYQSAGKPARMLATQLEATAARMVFPAFDEPAFRAVFELAVRAPKGWQVLANMPEAGAFDEGAQVMHRFEPTPPMPSYLVAVAVGQFEALSGSAAGVPLRVITAVGKREQAAYALQATQKLLPYYNDYFGIPYALPKLDLLAVPSTRGGAMEDWGLISYAENTLLFDPARSGTRTQRRVFSVVAHEVSHQWFGDLVTVASWEELWLNEAFATWMADKATAQFNPAWQTALRRRESVDEAMARDAGPATRPVRLREVPEDRVFDVFDDITYTKGGAVLAMIEQHLGAEPFRRGLAAYMNERRFSNATAGDLWHHMREASGQDIAALAASWTDQPGFPLVSASARCDGGRTLLTLRQERFSSTGSASAALWQVPLVLWHDGQQRVALLGERTQTLALPGCPALPTLVNASGDGFYRVAYAPAQHAALVRAFAQLPAAVQVAFFSDSFALAQAGRLPMSDFVALLGALPQGQGPARAVLFAQAQDKLAFLDEALAGTPAQAELAAAARALLAPELAALGWVPRSGEDSETEALRNGLIRDLARFGDAATLAQARELFDADESGHAALPAATRGAVILAVGHGADAARFAQLMQRLKTAERDEDRWLYANAVGSAADEALARQALELSLQGTLPVNVARRLPAIVAENPAHVALAYAFTRERWQALAEPLVADSGGRAWLLPGVAMYGNDRALAQVLRADQARLAGPTAAGPAERMAARVEALAAVKERDAASLVAAWQALTKTLTDKR